MRPVSGLNEQMVLNHVPELRTVIELEGEAGFAPLTGDMGDGHDAATRLPPALPVAVAADEYATSLSESRLPEGRNHLTAPTRRG